VNAQLRLLDLPVHRIAARPGLTPFVKWPGVHAIYERITVAGAEIVGPADRGGLRTRIGAGAARKVVMARPTLARPTGVGRALATYEIPIEGRDEWLAAARRLA